MKVVCLTTWLRRMQVRSWLGCGLLSAALLASAAWAKDAEPVLGDAPVAEDEEADEAPEPGQPVVTKVKAEAKTQNQAEAPAPLPADDDIEEAPLPAVTKAPRMMKQAPKGDSKEESLRQLCPKKRPVEKPLSDILVSFEPPDDGKTQDGHPFLPPDCAKELLAMEGEVATPLNLPRPWGEGTFAWKASGLCHRPLYFEDVTLERYGQKSIIPGAQPAISGLKFFGSLALLPYKMGVERPRECIYTLGYYRPGSCPPRLQQKLPLELDASLLEVGTIAGLILLLP